jgi:hypothetical protein
MVSTAYRTAAAAERIEKLRTTRARASLALVLIAACAGCPSPPPPPETWNPRTTQARREAQPCPATGVDAGISSMPRWHVDASSQRALREGAYPVPGDTLSEIKDAIDRRLRRDAPLAGVDWTGLGTCGPLWDPNRPKTFLCIIVCEETCSFSAGDVAEMIELELRARDLDDVQTGVTISFGCAGGVQAN